jgi:nitric oxide reductase large subunit
MLCGFSILGVLAYRTYTDEPPIPVQVVDPAGRALFTAEDVSSGQEVFLRNGLMEFGSVFGHGAYLGPDFTADYLHRAALITIDHYGGSVSGSSSNKLSMTSKLIATTPHWSTDVFLRAPQRSKTGNLCGGFL